VTASKDVIDRILSAKANVNLENIKETMNRESRITIYDRDGNVLPVEVEPSVVDITVPIKSPSKVLPFKIIREGELGQGLSVLSIEPKPNEVTVYGPLDILDKLEFIDGVKVDLSKIKEDTVLEVDVPIPEGVTKVNPEKLEIEVDIEKQEEQLFSDKTIKQVGLSDGKVLEFVNPATGSLDVKVYGAPSVIEDIKPEDIEVYINLTDLSDGEHEVNVEVNGPQNITWSLQQKKINVKISSAS
jgi:YbbR domain-containing protein